MPDMIVQHLNSKAEREGLSRRAHDPSIGPDDIDDLEDEDESDSSSNLQPVDNKSPDSWVGTPLLSPQQTPVTLRTPPTPDSLLDLVDEIRRKGGVNNKTPRAKIGGDPNLLSPDYSPETPNTLRSPKDPVRTPTIRSPIRTRTSTSPSTASLSLASDFLADVAAAKNKNAVTDLYKQLYHRRHW